MSDEVTPEAQPEASEAKPGVKLCPNGHRIRTKQKGLMCSSISCGMDRWEKEKEERLAAGDSLTSPLAERPFEARRRLSKLPKSALKGEEATKWAQDKLVELLPEAVASVAYDLRYGSDKQRSEATDKVLRANGVDRRDAPSSGQGGLIVLNLAAPQLDKVPWLQRMTNAVLPAQAAANDEDGDVP